MAQAHKIVRIGYEQMKCNIYFILVYKYENREYAKNVRGVRGFNYYNKRTLESMESVF